MQTDDPAFLPPGAEVSAKFKGAYCEATIKNVQKAVKVKVQYKEAPFGTAWLEHQQIKGNLVLNASVQASLSVPRYDNKQLVNAQILAFKDSSIYSVVFDDGDERTLRRGQVCLKGAKHFDETLDTMPLTNPEQFSYPVTAHTATMTTTTAGSSKKQSQKIAAPTRFPPKRKADTPGTSTSATSKRGARTRSPSSSSETEPLDVSYDSDSMNGSERDAFVARWYKFQEDKGDPMNTTPKLGNEEADLYRMYRCVKILGGYNKVQKDNTWAEVLSMMKVNMTGPAAATQLKKCYKRYMLDFEHFVRQFGWSYAGGERRIEKSRERTPTTALKGGLLGKRAREPNAQTQSATTLQKTKLKAVEEATTGRIRRRSFSSTPSTGSEQPAVASGTKCNKSPTRDEKSAPVAGSKRVNEASLNGYRLAVGDRLEAFNRNEWYPAKILMLDGIEDAKSDIPRLSRAFVHYHGWKARFDEWVQPNQLRRPDGTETKPERRKAETPIEETKSLVEPRRGVRRRANAEDEELTMEAKPKITEKLSKRSEAAKRSESMDEVKPAPMLRKRSTSTNKASMKIGSSEDEESEEASSGDETESKVEARVTRSRAAADPSVQIIRKWSRSNILVLEEEERPMSVTSAGDEQKPNTSSNSIASSQQTTRNTRRSHTTSVSHVDIESPKPATRPTALTVNIARELSVPRQSDTQTDDDNNSQSSQNDIDADNGKETNARRPTTRATRGQQPATPPPPAVKLRGPIGKRTGNQSEQNGQANASPNHGQSPQKDSLASIKARVLARMIAENNAQLQKCTEMPFLDDNLSDEQCIELIRRRMLEVQKAYSAERARFLRVDRQCRARAARTANSNGEQSSSTSTTPPQARPSNA